MSTATRSFKSLDEIRKQFDEKTICLMIERYLSHTAQQKVYHKEYNAKRTAILRLAKAAGIEA